jgi:hypothetical protein
MCADEEEDHATVTFLTYATRSSSVTQCNLTKQHTRSTHSQSDHTLARTTELESSQTLSSMNTKLPRCSVASQGWLVFVNSPKAKRAVALF